MIKKFIGNLIDADKSYKGIPFWSWNDRLDNDELKWQVREQERVGLGGYFMHARGGLKTEYMSDEWMDAVDTCVREGKKIGMESWIYDENGYPSGFAGGDIPALGVAYQQKYLKYEVLLAKNVKISEHTLGVYHTSGTYKKIDKIDLISEDVQVLQVSYCVNPYYVDLLDEKVVKKFIQSTHEKYYEKFKDEFGDGIQGIFTDEPQYGRNAIPWSFVLEKRFLSRYGYSIDYVLPALYYKVPGYEKYRYDFWNLLTELFHEAFSKQVSTWCEEHNCKLTGHVLLEETIKYQTMCSGSAMGFYEYMQIPGIDWLGREIGNPVIVKQVASVANQLGKEKVISEMFAATGWSASFEKLKFIAEWQYVLGVNLMCPHLEGYSLRGLRKRDHPQGMFYQSPWWSEYRKFNDYFSRLGMLLSEGENTADILIIHPMRTGWITLDESCYRGNSEKIDYIDQKFVQLSEILSGLHFNYHYGDEAIMKKYGSVKNGELKIGRANYKVVIIPPSITLDIETITMLKKFVKDGGKILGFEDFPYLCQGVIEKSLLNLKEASIKLTMNQQCIENALLKLIDRDISIVSDYSENTDIYHLMRNYDDGKGIYLLNINEGLSYHCNVKINDVKNVYLINLEDGVLLKPNISFGKKECILNLTFNPTQSYFILCSEMELEHSDVFLMFNEYKDDCNKIDISQNWDIISKDLNAITLDYCGAYIENDEFAQNTPVIKVQHMLLESEQNNEISLDFKILSKVDFNQDKELFLIIEDAEIYEIKINNVIIRNKISGWWLDKSFKKINIAGMIKKGENTITIRRYFYNSKETFRKIKKAKKFETQANMLSYDSEIESIYLVGDFVIESEQKYINEEKNILYQYGGFILNESKSTKTNGDLVQEGYPFFTGKIMLKKNISINKKKNARYIFQMDKPHATAVALYVNGEKIKTFMWSPYSHDITQYLTEGLNSIWIELISTNRNLLGPHHHPMGEVNHIGPDSFKDTFGWDNRYCFVKFGFNSVKLTENISLE